MKRWNQILCLSALLCIGPACTDELTPEPAIDPDNPSEEIWEDVALQLVDAEGNAVTALPPSWDRYYLRVNVPGAWQLEGEGGFVVPTVTHGEGRQLVPVIIGENWTTTRQGAIRLITQDTENGESRAATADKGDTTNFVVNQMSNVDLDEVKKILSSNRGAGFGYSYSGNYALGTTIEIFNMRALDSLQTLLGYHFLDDDYAPLVKQTLATGLSEEECNNKLAIEASLGVEYNKVNVQVDGYYNSNNTTDTKKQYARSQLNGTMFTREVHHYNILAISRENSDMYKQLYAPGFRMVCDIFKNDLDSALHGNWSNAPTTRTDSICKVFCEEYGPCLITKSVLGCSLDYTMAIDSCAALDSMGCGGSLELKIQFATASIDASAKGSYEHMMKEINDNAEFKCKVSGGDVMGVSILASGGQLQGGEVAIWQQSVQPKTAVLVDMRLAPIYSVIYDEKSQALLREYVNRKLAE